ncbi:MAG TPA: bifunctional diguanylate cyclase/phosphodiesterase [Micromonosporaceae bacterium]
MRHAVVALAAATDGNQVLDIVEHAVARLDPRRTPRAAVRVQLPDHADSAPATAQRDRGELVAVKMAVPGTDTRFGALLVDPATASRRRLREPLEIISVHAALALERLRLSQEVDRYRGRREFAALIEQTADVILVLDDDNRIRYASPSAATVFGTSQLHNVDLIGLIDVPYRRSAEFLLGHVRATATSSARADWMIRAADGRAVLVEVSCRDLRTEDSMRGTVLTLRDVTAQRRLEHELTNRMFRDPLTGLANRVLFADRIDHALAGRTGLTGVLLIDLDDFGSINDDLGHEMGDDVLRTVGRRLADAVGDVGLAARLGDDEFAALIPDADSPATVDSLAARITTALNRPVRGSDGTVVACGASVGVATTAHAGTGQDLLRNANLALHVAKSAGTGQWRHYEASMADALKNRSELRLALRRALDDASLFLEYQPIVALASGRTVGFEALLRWRHPTRGTLAPADFIDIAEESGLILPVGEWVLATALTTASRWRADSRPDDPPYVSVNVSPQQFRSNGFVDAVHRLLTETGLPPRRLVLEITEGVLLRDNDEVWERLRLLRSWGVRIAIDDFGTGYSALGYLRQIPLDIIKLDRSFISTLTTSERQRELVEGVVALTRSFNLDVVAEGIEAEQQREVSAVAGCAYGQGYLFGRPMSEADTFRWLSDADLVREGSDAAKSG